MKVCKETGILNFRELSFIYRKNIFVSDFKQNKNEKKEATKQKKQNKPDETIETDPLEIN